MFEIKKNIEIESGSERGFGFVFTLAFLIIGVYPVMGGGQLRLWSLIVALTLFALACIFPKALSIPNKLWFKLGVLLGSIISPIVMSLIFFIAVVPTGFVVHFITKDLLMQKKDKNIRSYWITRRHFNGSMKDQF